MKKYVLRYGLWGGCIGMTLGLLNWFTIAQWFGRGPSEFVGYTTMMLSLLCIPLGVKYFKDKLNNGEVSIAQALKIGLGISVLASAIMGLYSALFFVVVGDDFQKWQQASMTPAEIQQAQVQMAQMPEFAMNPWFQGFIMFLMVFLMGFVINLISALVLRKS